MPASALGLRIVYSLHAGHRVERETSRLADAIRRKDLGRLQQQVFEKTLHDQLDCLVSIHRQIVAEMVGIEEPAVGEPNARANG